MIMNIYNEQEEAQVVGICLSGGGIPKLPVDGVEVTFRGLKGDGHNHAKHNNPLQAISLQDIEILEDIVQEGFMLFSGTIGENLTVRRLDVQYLSPGTILEFTGGVALELTKERKPCYVLDAIDPRLKEVMIGRCGFYAKVLREGFLKSGALIHVKRPLIFETFAREWQSIPIIPIRKL